MVTSRILYRGMLSIVMVLGGGSYAHSQGSVAICNNLALDAKTDYRDRSTAQLRWNIDDNKRYHLDPASRRMLEGEYSHTVIADIDWTLVRYPNHQGALSLLIKYALAGGKSYEFQPPECYFKWAKEFAPDDGNVHMAEGYYNWRMNRFDEAIADYQATIKLLPDSAAAHYNLGLIYLEQKQYQEAARYAALAYQLGYPLTALRDKLAAVGHKLPNPQTEASTAVE